MDDLKEQAEKLSSLLQKIDGCQVSLCEALPQTELDGELGDTGQVALNLLLSSENVENLVGLLELAPFINQLKNS